MSLSINIGELTHEELCDKVFALEKRIKTLEKNLSLYEGIGHGKKLLNLPGLSNKTDGHKGGDIDNVDINEKHGRNSNTFSDIDVVVCNGGRIYIILVKNKKDTVASSIEMTIDQYGKFLNYMLSAEDGEAVDISDYTVTNTPFGRKNRKSKWLKII